MRQPTVPAWPGALGSWPNGLKPKPIILLQRPTISARVPGYRRIHQHGSSFDVAGPINAIGQPVFCGLFRSGNCGTATSLSSALAVPDFTPPVTGIFCPHVLQLALFRCFKLHNPGGEHLFLQADEPGSIIPHHLASRRRRANPQFSRLLLSLEPLKNAHSS